MHAYPNSADTPYMPIIRYSQKKKERERREHTEGTSHGSNDHVQHNSRKQTNRIMDIEKADKFETGTENLNLPMMSVIAVKISDTGEMSAPHQPHQIQ